MTESLYKRRIADGFCGMCGKEPIEQGESLGPVCKEKARQAAATKRQKARQDCLCVESGCKKKVKTPGARCKEHKAAQAQRRQESSKKLQEAGLCRNAASHGPAKEGATLCQECIDRLSSTASKHYFRRKEEGLCRFGNHPPLPGESMCAYHKEQHRDYKMQLKMEVMEVYGGCKCSWPGCDNENLDELHVHHVEGGGCAHRRDIGVASGGYNFYLWLRAEGYPPGYAVFCPTHHVRADNNLKKDR